VSSGSLALTDIWFKYSGEEEYALKDVSLTVLAGQSIAIVGRSGSGKSTLATLLLGLIEPTSGSILIGNKDICGLDLRCLRRQIGFVPQNPYIYAGTVSENITMFDPEIDEDTVRQAAVKACIHEDILRLPGAYATLLSEGGQWLSSGQRQRIAIARALVRDPVMLIFDEATSALDGGIESELMSQVSSLRCTKIVIAHRLSAIKGCDRILVLRDGRIAEEGTHLELISRKGEYVAIMASQLQCQDGHQTLGNVN